MTRFALGFIMMIGALVFLGCPMRMIIRMAAGDLNAWVGLIGFIAHSQHLWNILGLYAVGFAPFWLAAARCAR